MATAIFKCGSKLLTLADVSNNTPFTATYHYNSSAKIMEFYQGRDEFSDLVQSVIYACRLMVGRFELKAFVPRKVDISGEAIIRIKTATDVFMEFLQRQLLSSDPVDYQEKIIEIEKKEFSAEYEIVDFEEEHNKRAAIQLVTTGGEIDLSLSTPLLQEYVSERNRRMSDKSYIFDLKTCYQLRNN